MSHLVPEIAVRRGHEDTTDEDEVRTTDESGVSSTLVPLNIPLCFRSFVLQKCLMTLADNAASAAAAAALTVRRGADGAKVRNDGDELAATDSGLESFCNVQM